MQEPTDNHPPGTTHFSLGYGEEVNFYKKTEYPVLNNVAEEWQTRVKWYYWDFQKKAWEWVGVGFCSRRLNPI